MNKYRQFNFNKSPKKSCKFLKNDLFNNFSLKNEISPKKKGPCPAIHRK